MKTKTFITGFTLFAAISVFGQKLSVDLTFTSTDDGSYVRLDSIKVINRTQYPFSTEAVLYWPDTTMTLDADPSDLLLFIGYATKYPTGIQEIKQKVPAFQMFQNYPNPVQNHTTFSVKLPEEGPVSFLVTDIQGKIVLKNSITLGKGEHQFRFIPGEGTFYIVAAQWNGIHQSIKITCNEPKIGMKCDLNYIQASNGGSQLEKVLLAEGFMIESGILDSPVVNTTYTFQFATNMPCPGIPTVTYEGQVYSTIQIFSQCWLKENLNVGTMIPGSQSMTDNEIVEKYCYENDPDSCGKYGGLYQWGEVMQYTSQQGVQGICPPDWHLPTDEEWKVLAGVADTHFGIGDETWDMSEFRGFDAGTNLRTTTGWFGNGNGTDLFSFSGLPGGLYYTGSFMYITLYGYWWTSTETFTTTAWYHGLNGAYSGVRRISENKTYGFSVRCVKDL